MPDEVTKSLEKELDEIDDVGEIYEEESDEESEEESNDEASDETKTDTETTEEESDGEKKDSEEEVAGKETSEETDTSGKAESEEKEEGETESEAPEDLDGQQRIESLMAEIDRLSGLLVTQAPAKVKVAKEDKDEKSSVTAETLEDFIGDLDMDDVASKPEIMNELLNKVLQKGIETGKKLSAEQAGSSASSVSQTVATQVDNAITVKEMINKFYAANPELSNVKQVVQACASQIVQDSPDKSFKDVLNMAADAARKTLGIPKSTKKTEIAKAENVAFAEQKGGQRKKGKKVSKLQQELDEL